MCSSPPRRAAKDTCCSEARSRGLARECVPDNGHGFPSFTCDRFSGAGAGGAAVRRSRRFGSMRRWASSAEAQASATRTTRNAVKGRAPVEGPAFCTCVRRVGPKREHDSKQHKRSIRCTDTMATSHWSRTPTMYRIIPAESYRTWVGGSLASSQEPVGIAATCGTNGSHVQATHLWLERSSITPPVIPSRRSYGRRWLAIAGYDLGQSR